MSEMTDHERSQAIAYAKEEVTSERSERPLSNWQAQWQWLEDRGFWKAWNDLPPSWHLRLHESVDKPLTDEELRRVVAFRDAQRRIAAERVSTP